MKRKRCSHVSGGPRKRPKSAVHLANQSTTATPSGANHPVLRRFYPLVLTLRHYVLSKLQKSKKTHRTISQVGIAPSGESASIHEIDCRLGQLLDSTLVGCFQNANTESQEQILKARTRDIEIFTQQRSQGTTGGTFKPGGFPQSEIVDFVIWLLFKRSTFHKPSHLLCHGFQRGAPTTHANAADVDAGPSIPGLAVCSVNDSVRTLKDPAWCRLHALLGRGGDRIMMDLLLDGALFSPILGDSNNYHQLSGIPVSDLKAVESPVESPKSGVDEDKANAPPKSKPPVVLANHRSPGSIIFVRNRMMYARPALNARGDVRFGMRHIRKFLHKAESCLTANVEADVLNRLADRDDQQQTVHLMRYIFPRQFGLHNAFTSKVDPRETAMPFKDYTLREKEIHQSMCKDLGTKATDADQIRRWKLRTPKRLRGMVAALVHKMRVLNQRCSYTKMLDHYCPLEKPPSLPGSRHGTNVQHLNTILSPSSAPRADNIETKALANSSRADEQTCFTDMACPTSHVSAFCRAVITKVIPRAFWGSDSNTHLVLYWIDQFIVLRRFESLSLHDVTQKFDVASLAWLRPPGLNKTDKLAKTDFEKRKEILLELVFWLFDSFLIPLVRSNFHVTESNVHRHKLFYFRHDVWRMLTEPSLTTMKVSMFEEMPADRMAKLLSMRPLGYSKIRLLPKEHGFRTITNLRRRQQVTRNGTASLGRSINSVMTPVFNVITLEKSLQPDRFGSSLFSVTDILPRLRAFKASLQEHNLDNSPLYFAKVDVQSCFDTIPQSRLLSMVDSLMSMEAYQTGKHVEISPLNKLQRLDGPHVDPLPVKRYVAHSGSATDMTPFNELVQNNFVGSKSNTVFVNTNMQRHETKDNLMRLLREHVERNIIKIGKKYYRQKKGIPQGSILSSILCNFFYAALECEVLSFALDESSLLLRLLDDFLLVTVDRRHAEKFVRVMHRGHPDYGVVVKSTKSMANFDVLTDEGTKIPRSVGSKFSYCGICIDTRTLEISKRAERPTSIDIGNSLTVERSKMPGQTFHRKTLNAFKIQLKAMFIDTSLNSVATILANVYQSFLEAGLRCLEYVRVLSNVRATCSSLLIRIIENIIALAFVMLRARSRSGNDRTKIAVEDGVWRRQLKWLACKAFQTVFQRKQTQHGVLLAWLGRSLASSRFSDGPGREMVEGVVAGRRAESREA